MRRRGRTRGAGSRYTESTGDLLLADTSPMKLADMAELNIREDVVQTVRAEVKLLQAEIMAEFRATAQSIREDVVKELRSVMSSIQATVADHASAISALETSQGDIADRLEGLERQCVALAADNVQLKAAVDDQENRSRRQNIRVVGLPEGEEGPNPTAFMGSFLKDVLGAEIFPNVPVIDRAHLTLAAKPPPGKPPRPMLVRLHHLQTKELILRTTIL